MAKPAKNTVCLWYDGDAEAAARFYAKRCGRINQSS
jgi:predicted 3-demethylubiquinone-9 3-methyltransferase (glyoxalase superfamily)